MVFISRILPNPVGKDTDGEIIVIKNDGKENVSVLGWKLKDGSEKEFVFRNDFSIKPGEEVSIPYQISKIFLNNNGDKISLIDRSGNLVDEIKYKKPKEGVFVAHNKNFGETFYLSDKNYSANIYKSFNLTQNSSKNFDIANSVYIVGTSIKDILIPMLAVSIVLTLSFWKLFKYLRKD